MEYARDYTFVLLCFFFLYNNWMAGKCFPCMIRKNKDVISVCWRIDIVPFLQQLTKSFNHDAKDRDSSRRWEEPLVPYTDTSLTPDSMNTTLDNDSSIARYRVFSIQLHACNKPNRRRHRPVWSKERRQWLSTLLHGHTLALQAVNVSKCFVSPCFEHSRHSTVQFFVSWGRLQRCTTLAQSVFLL
jgi:hypothetical protein